MEPNADEVASIIVELLEAMGMPEAVVQGVRDKRYGVQILVMPVDELKARVQADAMEEMAEAGQAKLS
jgi:hypothetical protein